MAILFFVILSMVSSSLGVIEGILYSRKGADAFKTDEHKIYLASRIFIFSSIIAGRFFVSDHEFIISLIAAVLSFPFFHDGFYYCTRGLVDKPDYKFNSSSTTTSAVMEFKWKWRLSFFIVSILLLSCDLLIFNFPFSIFNSFYDLLS